jgi:hypothetical protein
MKSVTMASEAFQPTTIPLAVACNFGLRYPVAVTSESKRFVEFIVGHSRPTCTTLLNVDASRVHNGYL